MYVVFFTTFDVWLRSQARVVAFLTLCAPNYVIFQPIHFKVCMHDDLCVQFQHKAYFLFFFD